MSKVKNLIIAVDGYSSCGKSTFAKLIAQKLGYVYIDTGSMYRAVTLFACQNNLIDGEKFDKETLVKKLDEVKIHIEKNIDNGKNETYLNNKNVEEEIRGMRISELVSQVSQIKAVRNKMVDLQRRMAKEKGIVMDGRDIGTVVFPDADIKIFMTANPDIRARRRYDELVARGDKVSIEEVKENLLKRDQLDTSREESPLKQAPDAYVLDNSNMTIEEELVWFVDIFNLKLKN
jgi:CMP/dCMP kinase